MAQLQGKWIANGAITKAKLNAEVVFDTPNEEMHKVIADDVTAGFFSLAETPSAPGKVRVTVAGGPELVNKQVVGSTGVTPDFDVLNDDELHINNTVASGLSEIIAATDVLIVTYEY